MKTNKLTQVLISSDKLLRTRPKWANKAPVVSYVTRTLHFASCTLVRSSMLGHGIALRHFILGVILNTSIKTRAMHGFLNMLIF